MLTPDFANEEIAPERWSDFADTQLSVTEQGPEPRTVAVHLCPHPHVPLFFITKEVVADSHHFIDEETEARK